MPSNAFVALGGLADGLGRSLQHKADQEHDDQQKHLDLINNLVVGGITSGRVTDPEQAFKFLLNNGKPGGKDLPPAVSSLISAALAHHTAQGPQGMPASPFAESSPSATAGMGAPEAGVRSGSGSSDDRAASTGSTPSSPSASTQGGPAAMPPAALPSPGARPGSSNPMGGFKTADQIAEEESVRKGKDIMATTTAGLNAKIAVARRLFQQAQDSGDPITMREANELAGLRKPTPFAGLSPKNVALPIPLASVPPGALTINGDPFPFDQPGVTHAQKSEVWSTDGAAPHWETRFEPSGPPSAGAGGGQLPAKFRERVAELTAAHGPGTADPWTPQRIQTEAGTALSREAATAASLGATREQVAGEAAGTKAGPYDDLPTVLPNTDGSPDTASQQDFLAKLTAKPKGGILATNVKQAAEYKMPSSDFTSRQIGGLNRATFVGLVKQYDPSFDEALYKPRQEMLTSWRGAGKEAVLMASARKIVNHLNDFSKANAEMDKVSSNIMGGIFNQAYIEAQKKLGDKKVAEQAQKAVATYDTIKKGIAAELRKFYAAGSGSGSLQELEAWEKSFNPYGTSVERKAAMNAAAHLMIGQVVPKVEAYRSLMKTTPPGDLWINNRDRLRLRGMGVDISDLPPLPENERNAPNPAEKNLDPQIQALPPGMKITMPDGKVWYRDAFGILRGGTTTPPKP